VIRRPAALEPARRGARRAAASLAVALLVAGCLAAPDATPDASASPTAAAGVPPTLSPEAAKIPSLEVDIAGRQLDLAGYDPAWGADHAGDRRLILTVAPYLQLERGRTYDVTLRFQGTDPVTGWLPPDFGYSGGSAPVRTANGFVPEVPTSAFVRDDALPDFEAGLFGVSIGSGDAAQLYAYPVWIQLPDIIDPEAFKGIRVGLADEDGGSAADAFLAHVREDLDRGGAPAPKAFATRADVLAAFDAGDLDAYISIPAGWTANPTTDNDFKYGAHDPVTGNSATDTGTSYVIASLVVRALGPGGLILDRGY
jgi:hypothetical protein